MTRDTSGQERKLIDATRQVRLAAMLRNMLRSYPSARLQHSTRGDFGVSLGEGRFLRITWSGDYPIDTLRDLLVLFAVWVLVDPSRVLNPIGRDGSSVTERLPLEPCSGRQGLE